MLKLVKKALHIKRTLGTRYAAGFLRNEGVTCEAAVAILATPIYMRQVRIADALVMG